MNARLKGVENSVQELHTRLSEPLRNLHVISEKHLVCSCTWPEQKHTENTAIPDSKADLLTSHPTEGSAACTYTNTVHRKHWQRPRHGRILA